MKFYQNYVCLHENEFSSNWLIFILSNYFHHNIKFSSKWWVFITTRNLYHDDCFHQNNSFSSQWLRLIFITMRNFIKIISLIKWWTFITMINEEFSVKMLNLYENDDLSPISGIFIKKASFRNNVEFSLKWQILITLFFCHHDNKFSLHWWISITMMNFHHSVEFSSQR